MIEASALKNRLSITEKELITSGSVNVYTVHFHFSSHWDDLEKIAVFRTQDAIINIPVEDNKAVIPWEVTTTPGYTIRIGVYGIKAGEIILPTIWASLGMIDEGVIIGDAESGDHTPDIYDAILQKVSAIDKNLDAIHKELDNLYNAIPDDDELEAIIIRILKETTVLKDQVSDYLKENPPIVSEETLAQMINNYLSNNQVGITEERVLELINQTVGAAIRDGY